MEEEIQQPESELTPQDKLRSTLLSGIKVKAVYDSEG